MKPHDERGEVSAQIAVLAPVLFLLAFLAVQASSLWMAAQTASIAARRGARAASMAIDRGNLFLVAAESAETTASELGSRLAAPPRVTVGVSAVAVSVTVRVGSSGPLVPDHVTRSVTLPLEQFVGEDGR